ncbi:ATP-binding protein [Streptomyces ficellus]|uniref:sensor histidine kinase n=1 Tax=Streptomyces ficellus TaxID=1977088 RepID=UPI003CC71078
MLPPVVVALGGAATLLFTIRTTGAHLSPAVWAALAASAGLAVAAVGAALLSVNRAAAAVLDRCDALRQRSARSQNELRALVEQLRRGERPPARQSPPPLPAGGDGFDRLADELNRAHDAALTTVVQASRLSSSVGNEQKVEVFVNLARRLQSLVHREIQLLDELENEVEDPELLKGLFHIDHLATRIRRHAENLAVLGGAISRRQWSNPVTMMEVLRSSIAEVEHYPRVKLVPPIDGTLRGHAVADVIHLLAELVENATLFSAPHTPVLLRAQYVTAGLAVEVEDRGLGMSVSEQNKMNALLTDPDQVNVAHLLQDGRIGLFVVSALARRHGIAVRLQSNIYGGVQAVLVLPQGLLGADPDGLSTAERQAVLQAGHEEAYQNTHQEAHQEARAQPRTPLGEQAPGQPRETLPDSPREAPREPVHHAGPARHIPGEVTVPEPVHRKPVHAPTAPPMIPHQHQHQQQHGGGNAPLPVRGERSDRPNPASATPGTPGRPQLPKRRAQEHIVPQLRDAPTPRKHDDDALHDPGLMAAFRRGIGLAESMPAVPRDAAYPEQPAHPQAPENALHLGHLAQPGHLAHPGHPEQPPHPAQSPHHGHHGHPEPQRHDEAHKE